MLRPQNGKLVLGSTSSAIKSGVTFKLFRSGVKATVMEAGGFMWLLSSRMNLHSVMLKPRACR